MSDSRLNEKEHGGSENELKSEKLGKVEVFEKQLDSFFLRSAKEKEANTEKRSDDSDRGYRNESMTGKNDRDITPPEQISGRKPVEMFPTDFNSGLSSLQNAFGKIINNTKTFGKQVVENVSNSVPRSQNQQHSDNMPNLDDKRTSPTMDSNNNKNNASSSNIMTNVQPLLNQTSTALSGFRSNIMSFGNNIFEQFSSAVKPKDGLHGSNLGDLANDLVLYVEYDKTNSPLFKSIQEHIRFFLYSQTKNPQLFSRIKMRVESLTPNDAPVSGKLHKSIASSYETSASRSSALLNEKHKKSPAPVSKKNAGVFYVTEMMLNPDDIEGLKKGCYGFYTKLISENGFTELSSYNTSATVPLVSNLESNRFLPKEVIYDGINVVLLMVLAEIYEWMVAEYKYTTSKSSINQNVLSQNHTSHEEEGQMYENDLEPWK